MKMSDYHCNTTKQAWEEKIGLEEEYYTNTNDTNFHINITWQTERNKETKAATQEEKMKKQQHSNQYVQVSIQTDMGQKDKQKWIQHNT